MKRLYFLVLLTLACLMATAPASAQTDLRVTFHVDFPFIAGGASMPPGAYAITEDDNGHALIYPVERGRGAAILLTRMAGFGPARGGASVSFVRRGGRYYLDTINTLDGSIVHLSH